MESLSRALSSTKLTVAVCLVLAAAGVAGSLLYVGNTTPGTRGTFNLFRSPLFLVPAALLVLNILVCAGSRLSSRPPRAARTWTFAGIHMGIVLAAAGLATDGLYGFVGTRNYYPGIPASDYLNWRTSRNETFPFAVEVTNARVDHYPLNLQVGVRDAAGKKMGPYIVREGISFRPAGTRLVVTPRRFDPETKTLRFDAEVGGEPVRDLVAGTGGSLPVGGYVVVPVAFADPEPSGYTATIRFTRHGRPPEEKTAHINHPAEYGGVSFAIVSLARDPYMNEYVGLQMTREPGAALFWAGSVLFALCLTLHLLLAGRRPVEAPPEPEAPPRPAVPVAGLMAGLLLAAVLSGPGEAAAAGRSITGEERWEGEVRVVEPVSVEKGATLRILPGTRVLLSGRDGDGDGCGDGYILVRGSLFVDGERGKPVRFMPLDPGRPWEEIFFADAKGIIRYAVFEGARWGVHIHDGDVSVEQALFRNNGGGARTRGAGARFDRCTFRKNGVGLRFWDGGPSVSRAIIEDNDIGLFYREGKGGGTVRGSLIGNREWDLKVGDWADGGLDVSGNHWKAAGADGLPRRFRNYREAGSGAIVVGPSLPGPPAVCGADIGEDP